MNSSSEPIRIGNGSTIEVMPAVQHPRTTVMRARLVGTEDRHVVAGGDAPGLQGGADGTCFVVDLAPRHELGPAVGRHGRTDEAHPGRRIGGQLETLDRRRGTSHTVVNLVPGRSEKVAPGRGP